MQCNIHKFMISHAADRGRRPSPMTLRHIERCDSCQRFHEHCLLMEAKMKCGIDNRTSHQQNERVRQVISAIPERPPVNRRRVIIRPIAAAACLGFLITAAVIYLVVRSDTTIEQPPEQSVVQQIPAGDILAVLNQPLTDPLSGELKQIADEAESATRFLVACVNVGIDNQTATEN